MKQKRVIMLGVIAVVIIGAGVFYACNKYHELNTTRDGKLIGSIQPTMQIIDINTVIRVGTAEYPVVGTAVVGNYDGRIYECNVTWVIPPTIEGDDAFTMSLNATLKPEYHDIMLDFEPIMDNYIITITNPDKVTAESVHSLWTRIVEICDANVVKDFRIPYILALSKETGINIFELAASPFFLEYLSQLNEFNTHFMEQIRNNVISMAEFDALLQEFSQAPMWNEGEAITADHHQFYILAERLSRMYFGDNFNHEVVFDGVTYHVALDRINSLRNSYKIFEQAMINSYPQYVDLPEYLRGKVIGGGLIMGCYDDLLTALNKASNEYAKATDACDKLTNEDERKKCRQGAADVYSKARTQAYDDYCECLKKEGKPCTHTSK